MRRLVVVLFAVAATVWVQSGVPAQAQQSFTETFTEPAPCTFQVDFTWQDYGGGPNGDLAEVFFEYDDPNDGTYIADVTSSPVSGLSGSLSATFGPFNISGGEESIDFRGGVDLFSLHSNRHPFIDSAQTISQYC